MIYSVALNPMHSPIVLLEERTTFFIHDKQEKRKMLELDLDQTMPFNSAK